MERELFVKDIKDMVVLFWSKLWIIIIIAVVLGSGAFAYYNYYVTPKYIATVSLYVYASGDDKTATTAGEIAFSQKLVDTYVVILRSDAVLDAVAEKVGLGYTGRQINSMISAAPIDETEVFQISVINPDPQHALLIANTIAEVAPPEIIRVVKAGDVQILDYAKRPSAIKPNASRNGMFAAIIGAALAMLLIYVLDLLDTNIREEADIIENFNVPVIGVIPNIGEKKRSRGYKPYYKNTDQKAY